MSDEFGHIEGYQPEWFVKALEKYDPEYALSENYIVDIEAMDAAIHGNLKPVAAILKKDGQISPYMRRFLVFLIEGNIEQSGGLRLEVEKHPKISAGRKDSGRALRFKAHLKELGIAHYVLAKGGNETGMHSEAVKAAMDHFKVGRTWVERVWKKHRDSL